MRSFSTGAPPSTSYGVHKHPLMNITARRIARAPMTPRNALPDFEDSESFSLRPSDVSGGSLTYQKSSWSPPHPSIDPDIWSVLELASEDELEEIWDLLHAPSLFSPVVKTVVISSDDEPLAISYRGREAAMRRIEKRIRFLSADALSAINGRDPSYRDTLLKIHRRMGLLCPRDLSTSDLECEVFLELLRKGDFSQSGNSAPVSGRLTRALTNTSPSEALTLRDAAMEGDGSARSMPSRRALDNFLQALAASLKYGASELSDASLKLLSATALTAVQQRAVAEVARQLILSRGAYEAALLCLKEGMRQQTSTVALFAAQKGLTTATARYSAVRASASILGPLLWGVVAADLTLKAVGTDYGRVMRVVFALAQIRLVATLGFVRPGQGGGSGAREA